MKQCDTCSVKHSFCDIYDSIMSNEGSDCLPAGDEYWDCSYYKKEVDGK